MLDQLYIWTLGCSLQSMVSIWEALQYCPQPFAPRVAGTAAQSTQLRLTFEEVTRAPSSFSSCRAAHLAIEADHQPLLALLALDHINGGIHVLQQGGYSGAICNAWVHMPGVLRGLHIPTPPPPPKGLYGTGALAACLVQAALLRRRRHGSQWLT